jgi:heme O synthase-like polyprenyltransferase
MGLLALLLVLAAFTLKTVNTLEHSIDQTMSRSTKRIVLADAINIATADMSAAQRGRRRESQKTR